MIRFDFISFIPYSILESDTEADTGAATGADTGADTGATGGVSHRGDRSNTKAYSCRR